MFTIQVWSLHYEIHKERLERVQKKCFRFIAFKQQQHEGRVNYDHIAATLNLLPLAGRCIYLDLMLFYKIVNSLVDAPELLNNIGLTVPQRTLRNHNLFEVTYHRTNYGYNNPLTRMCREMNLRAPNLDMFNLRISSFKTKIKQLLYNTVHYVNI